MDISSTTTSEEDTSSHSSYDTDSNDVLFKMFNHPQDSDSSSSSSDDNLVSGPVSDASQSTTKQSTTSRYSMRDNRPVII